jgi:hypothetical protein
MRPARRIKQAEDAARSLKALLSSSMLSQLLQRTPPAALTAEQTGQLSRCYSVILQLQATVKEETSLRMQLVDAMLKQQVACSTGRLVTWLQQQPEQHLLDFTEVAVPGHQGSAPVTCVAGCTTATTWAAGVVLLQRIAAIAALHISQSAGACSLATNLTQQLEQSGKACSQKFTCTAQ